MIFSAMVLIKQVRLFDSGNLLSGCNHWIPLIGIHSILTVNFSVFGNGIFQFRALGLVNLVCTSTSELFDSFGIPNASENNLE